MKELDAYQLIDSYLNGELNADEKLAVETRIQSDTEFAETFSILEKVYVKVEDKGALNLVHRLHELSEQYPADQIDLSVDDAAAPAIKKEQVNVQAPKDVRAPKGTNKIMKWLLPILVAGGALLYYFMNKSAETAPNIETPVQEIPNTIPDNNTNPQKVESPVEKTIEEQSPVKEKTPEEKAPPKKEEKPQPKLYAAADFEVNDMMDKMIGTTTRTSELNFEVTSPQLNQNFPESTTTISFKGKTNSTDAQKGKFRLLSNKRIDISQQDINASGDFNFSTKIPKPGLYYYTLKFGSKTYVGKFTVGKK